jgi:hypothetical protein
LSFLSFRGKWILEPLRKIIHNQLVFLLPLWHTKFFQ